MPTLYMLIGVPAAGKSTWVKQHQNANTLVASSDDYIERQAERMGSTYNDVFDDFIKSANTHAIATAKKAFSDNLDEAKPLENDSQVKTIQRGTSFKLERSEEHTSELQSH